MTRRSLAAGDAKFLVTAWSLWLINLVAGWLTRSPISHAGWRSVLILAADFCAVACCCQVVRLVFRVPYLAIASRRSLRVGFMVVAAGLAWLMAFLYMVSWVMYERTHYFLGLDGLEFLKQNLRSVLLHLLQVEPLNFWLVVVGSGLGTAMLYIAIQRFGRRLANWPAGWVAPSLLFIVMGAAPLSRALVTVAPGVIDRPELGFGTVVWENPLPRHVRDHAGPAPHMLAEAVLQLRAIGPPAFPAPAVQWRQPLDQSVREPAEMDALVAQLTRDDKRVQPLSEYLRGISRASERQPNVLLVVIDSLRPDRLSAFGAQREVMPNLDRLAARAAAFACAYTQSPHSNYSDTSLLGSQYPLRVSSSYYGFRRMTYPRILPYDLLKPLGYRTAIFSSQNEEWGGMLRFLDTGSLDIVFHGETFHGPTYYSTNDQRFTQFAFNEVPQAGKVPDRFTVHAALDWIGQRPRQPFFVYLNLQGSHFPYLWPAGVTPQFSPTALPEGPLARTHIRFGGYPQDLIPVMRNRYDSSLFYIDQLLGQVLRQLNAWDILDDTIIVVTGDNGEAFYEHGVVTHSGPLWETSIRVPLVIAGPGVSPGVTTWPVQHIDIMPSVLELLGLPPHPALQGRSVFTPPIPGRALYFLVQTPFASQAAVRVDDYKLIDDWRTGTYQLFNVGRDPGEEQNLLKEEPEVFKLLQQRLRNWYALQLAYYARPDINVRYYAPAIE